MTAPCLFNTLSITCGSIISPFAKTHDTFSQDQMLKHHFSIRQALCLNQHRQCEHSLSKYCFPSSTPTRLIKKLLVHLLTLKSHRTSLFLSNIHGYSSEAHNLQKNVFHSSIKNTDYTFSFRVLAHRR